MGRVRTETGKGGAGYAGARGDRRRPASDSLRELPGRIVPWTRVGFPRLVPALAERNPDGFVRDSARSSGKASLQPLPEAADRATPSSSCFLLRRQDSRCRGSAWVAGKGSVSSQGPEEACLRLPLRGNAEREGSRTRVGTPRPVPALPRRTPTGSPEPPLDPEGGTPAAIARGNWPSYARRQRCRRQAARTADPRVGTGLSSGKDSKKNFPRIWPFGKASPSAEKPRFITSGSGLEALKALLHRLPYYGEERFWQASQAQEPEELNLAFARRGARLTDRPDSRKFFLILSRRKEGQGAPGTFFVKETSLSFTKLEKKERAKKIFFFLVGLPSPRLRPYPGCGVPESNRDRTRFKRSPSH